MPNYRRARVPGGIYFFTVVTHRRRRLFNDAKARTLLGGCLRECRERWPFETTALVLLPGHLHAIWSLPSGDDAYSVRWAWIKKEFTMRWLSANGCEADVSESRSRERRRGVWHPRFWEHTIDDEEGFQRHFDYVHYNPVKHGCVRCPHEWPHSSFHRWVTAGVYDRNWACWEDGRQMLNFEDIEDSVGG